MSEWQPIETAPRDGTPILGVRVYKYPGHNGEPYIDGAVMMYEGGPGRVLRGGWAYMGLLVRMVDERDEPTHWMPLPPPPATGAGE